MYTVLILLVWLWAGCLTVKATEKQLKVKSFDFETEALIVATFPIVLLLLVVRGYLLEREK